VCGHCGQPLERDDEGWLRPWRASTPLPLAPAVNAGGHGQDRDEPPSPA
jgi:hypothetical protein